MIIKTFKLTIGAYTEEQMQKEEEYLSMVYGVGQIEEDKPGKWVIIGKTNGSIPHIVRECSHCGYVHSMTANFKYCPNCGNKKEAEDVESK